MKPFIPVLCLGTCLAITSPGQGDDALGELVSYAKSTMHLLHPSSAAVVVSRGEEVILEAYLTGSFEGLPRTNVTDETLFYLASGTKAFSAGLLMVMAEEGIVGLDEPVSKYLPAFREPGGGAYPRTAVRLRHLASHTSGLRSPDEEANGKMDEVIVATEPGSTFRYSDVGMVVLQQVLEAASGKAYGQLMEENILSPLGLGQTRYLFQFDESLPLIAAKAESSEQPDAPYFYSRKGHLAGGGLYATAKEVNRYAQLWALEGTIAGERYFSRNLFQEAIRTHGISDHNGAHYGLLWWLFPESDAIVMSGATHSVSAIVPKSATVVTVMRNYYGVIPAAFEFHEDKKKLVDFATAIGDDAQ